MSDKPLAGVGILVTRPTPQASELIETIEALGGVAIGFPVIEIVPLDAAVIAADACMLQRPDIVIFVSRNAVLYGHTYAANAVVAAVGPATAAALDASGLSADIKPTSGFDSEHLLAEPDLINVDGKVVRIVRGNDGRELLAETLRERGAQVEYLSVYTRRVPEYSGAELHALETRWRKGEIDVVLALSVESVRNLAALLPDWCNNQLRHGSLVTPAARVLKEALEKFPGTTATVAAGPSASEMIGAIIELGQDESGKP